MGLDIGAPAMQHSQATILARLIMVLCVLGLCLFGGPSRVLAEANQSSEFDLTAFSQSGQQKAVLRGDWWFEFGKLVHPPLAAQAAADGEFGKIRVPMDWRQALPVDPQNPYQHGLATYVIQLTLPDLKDDAPILALPRIADAYEVFWVPSKYPEYFSKIGGDGTMEGPLVPSQAARAHGIRHFGDGYLVLHVRKELQGYGGILRAPYIMAGGRYQSDVQLTRILEGCVLGITLFVTLLNLYLYLVYRKDPATLILAIASFALLLRSLILAETLEMQFGAEIRGFRIRLEYAGILIIAWASYALHQTLLWRTFSNLRGPIIVGLLTMLGSAFLFSAPLPSVTDNLIYVQVFCIFTFVLILHSSAQAILAKQPDAWFYTLGWSVPLLAGINDIFVSMTYKGVYLVNYAFVAFIIGYSFKLGGRVTRAISRAELLEQERQTLQQLHQDAVDSARHDHLTGLLNRQAFDNEMALFWQEKDTTAEGLSLVIFDIDHFKSVNDTHGHPAGDDVLRSIAELLRGAHLRKTDRVCRYGGEEFVILLPDTSCEDAQIVAERVRKRIETHRIKSGTNVWITVTSSFGIAHAAPLTEMAPGALIEQADKALYHAKNSGRNRSVMYDEIEELPQNGASVQALAAS